jgi:branched-chain amino acid transport system permease protein
MIYQQVINGLMLGASYSLVAIGYTLIFGVLGLLYFAHGEVFMVGAFVGLYLVLYAGANIYVALLGATIACAMLGIMSVYVAVRPVAKDRPLAPLISTIGLTIVLQNLAVYTFGGQQVGFPETIKQQLFTFGPITISSVQLFILGVAVLLMVSLWFFIERTRIGRAIRATAENHETAALLGVDVNKVVLVTFAIGSGIAGIAGVLDGVKNSGISPFMGVAVAVKGLIVMLLGGLGNVPGAMVAGLMLGMIEILSSAFTSRPGCSARAPRKKGSDVFDGLLDGYTRSILIFAGINVIAAYSFFAPFKTGQVSLGQAGFMAVGAYASAILTQKFGVPFAAALVAGGTVAGIIGFLVGFPALRIRGIYLLLLTLGFGEIIQVIALSWEYVGGAQGFRQIAYNPRTLDYVIGLIVVLILFFARLERSSLGRAMDSIHQDEMAAEVMGIDVVRTKLFAFALGALIAGLAGGLYAHQATFMDSTTFNIMVAVEILMFVVVGGSSTYWGPLLGAGFLTLLPEFLRTLREWLELLPVSWTNFFPMNRAYDVLHNFLDFENAKRLIVYGIILIVMMIVRPDGLLTRDALRRFSWSKPSPQRKPRHV